MNILTLDILFNLLVLTVEFAILFRIRKGRNWISPRVILPMIIVILVMLMNALGHLFLLMRLASWLLFFHAPLVAGISAFLLWSVRRKLSILAAGGSIGLFGIAVDAFYIEPKALEINHHHLVLPGVPHPFTIGILADLQTDRVGAYEKKALEWLMAEKPDLILLPGDYIQAGRKGNREEGQALSKLLNEVNISAPLGVFAVNGNVEYPFWPDMFKENAVTPFKGSKTIEINHWLSLTGLKLSDSNNPKLKLKAPGGKTHIVFGHCPDYALGSIEGDLLIAGHTHGGQVRIPFFGPPITLSRVPRDWAAGVTETKPGQTLVVSRGVGMERGAAPRLRFLCRPELVILHISPKR